MSPIVESAVSSGWIHGACGLSMDNTTQDGSCRYGFTSNDNLPPAVRLSGGSAELKIAKSMLMKRVTLRRSEKPSSTDTVMLEELAVDTGVPLKPSDVELSFNQSGSLVVLTELIFAWLRVLLSSLKTFGRSS
jgi:hypothetical protein